MIYGKLKEIRENSNMTQKETAILLNNRCSVYELTKIKQYKIINKDIARKIVTQNLKYIRTLHNDTQE